MQPALKTLRILANPHIAAPALTNICLDVSHEQLPELRAVVKRVGASLDEATFVVGINEVDMRSDARKEKLQTVRAFITDVCEACADEMPQLTSLSFILRSHDRDKMSCFPDLSFMGEKFDQLQELNTARAPGSLRHLKVFTEANEVAAWMDAAAHVIVRNVSLWISSGGDMMHYAAPTCKIAHPAIFHLAVRVKPLIATMADHMMGGFYFVQKLLPELGIHERSVVARFLVDDEYRQLVLSLMRSGKVESLLLYFPMGGTGLRIAFPSVGEGASEEEVQEEAQKMFMILRNSQANDPTGVDTTFSFLRQVLPLASEADKLHISFELILFARSHPAETRTMLDLIPNVEQLTLVMPTFMPLGDAFRHPEMGVTQDFLLSLPDFLDMLAVTFPKLTDVYAQRLAKALKWDCPTKGRAKMFEEAFEALDRFERARDDVCIESLRVLVEVFRMTTPKSKLK